MMSAARSRCATCSCRATRSRRATHSCHAARCPPLPCRRPPPTLVASHHRLPPTLVACPRLTPRYCRLLLSAAPTPPQLIV
jgi:hypothetical protein